MVRAKPAPLDVPPDYGTDFEAWSFARAALARAGRVQDLDWPNVIEELESLGNEQRYALTSCYRVLLVELLKWAYQPERRSPSWQARIARERGNIGMRERTNRSLAARADGLLAEAHRRARPEAAAETGPALEAFPADCPFTLAQLRDDDFMPA